MRHVILPFLAVVVHGCTNGGPALRDSDAVVSSKARSRPESAAATAEGARIAEIPQRFFGKWAYANPDCNAEEKHLGILIDESGFSSFAYPQVATINEFRALTVRTFSDAPDRIEIDVKSEGGVPSPDTIVFRLIDNGQQLEWSQIGALKKIILFRCEAESG
jgi:hypothetical protein